MPDIKEEWRDIEGYEGLYQVSNLGRVKSINYRGHIGKERILKPQKCIRGYTSIILHKNKIIDNRRIHRLVAQAFIPNPDNKPTVNHIDGNKRNNIITNLEWATHSEQIQHALATGLSNGRKRINKKSRKKGHPSSNRALKKEDIEYIRKVYTPYDKKFGAKALSKKMGISRSGIHKIIAGETYKKRTL